MAWSTKCDRHVNQNPVSALYTGMRSILLLWLLAAGAILTGCGNSSGGIIGGTPPQSGLFKDNSTSIGGVQRTYDYYIPSGLGSQPAPLVILLHGGLGSADTMTGADGSPAPFRVWMDVAEAEKLILVFPEGLIRPNGETGWNDCRGDTSTTPSSDDVAFIAELIRQFSSSYNTDHNRIYASGISNGGFMSLRLALELSDRIAAVGVIAAGMPAVSKCPDAVRPTSVLFMNGTDDPLVPYPGGAIGNPADGRGSVLSTADSVHYWTGFNQTQQTAPISDLPDIDGADGSSARRYRYYAGLEQTEVVLYEINGGGHSGPSMLERYSPLAELVIGRQNHDFEMAREVWEFFRDKRLQ